MNTITTPPPQAHKALPDQTGNGHEGHGQPGQDGTPGHDSKAADTHDLPTDLHQPSGFVVLLVGIGAVLLLAAMFLIGYFPHRAQKTQIDSDAQATANATPTVQLAAMKPSAPESDVYLPTNNVQAWQVTELYPRVTGYIASWTHDLGAHVNKGDVLAVISAPDVDAQLLQSKANLAQGNAAVTKANADVTIAKNTYDRYLQWMNTTAGVSKQDLEDRLDQYQDAKATLDQAKANVDALSAAVQQLQVQQSFERIIAPFSGIVTQRNYDVGALMIANNSTAKPMFELQETDQLRTFINVPQTYASTINVGNTKGYLTVRNYPNHEFEGVVARTAGALDPASRTLLTEVDVQNPGALLKPAMFGAVRLPVSVPHPALIIPTSALVFDAKGLRVAVVKDGAVHFADIEVGRDYGTTIEVTKGIAPGDQVIDNPGEQIAEGSQVQVEQPGGKPAGGQPNQRVAQAN